MAAGAWPAQCDVAVCSERLEEAYELAQTSFMHDVMFIKYKYADSTPNLWEGDWFKRLGCNTEVRMYILLMISYG
jgi:hypothetical protein